MRNDLTERPRNLTVGGLGNRPIVPKNAADSAAVGKFQSDSLAAEQGLSGLMGTQQQLLDELQRVQGAPGMGGVTVAPVGPTETISLDPASGRRIATDSKTGAQRYIDPPR